MKKIGENKKKLFRNKQERVSKIRKSWRSEGNARKMNKNLGGQEKDAKHHKRSLKATTTTTKTRTASLFAGERLLSPPLPHIELKRKKNLTRSTKQTSKAKNKQKNHTKTGRKNFNPVSKETTSFRNRNT